MRAGTSVLTASRVEEGSGYVRVMGPGKADGMQQRGCFSSWLLSRDWNLTSR